MTETKAIPGNQAAIRVLRTWTRSSEICSGSCPACWADVGVVAYNTTLSDLQDRVNDDPFVAENVVRAEILEITPAKADERLNFLLP